MEENSVELESTLIKLYIDKNSRGHWIIKMKGGGEPPMHLRGIYTSKGAVENALMLHIKTKTDIPKKANGRAKRS